MNNNNLYNNNNFIGITHLDNGKITSNFIIQTSNILEQHILNTSNTLEGHLSNTSNVLEGHILDAKNSNINYTNALRTDVNKWINEEIEHITLPVPADITHTYIYNSNIAGEIRFMNKGKTNYPVGFPPGTPNYKAKIDFDGKLKLYYIYNPVINATWLSGWIEPMDIIVGLAADSFNQGATITGLGAKITLIDNDLTLAAETITVLQAEIADIQAQILHTGVDEARSEAESISEWGSESSTIQEQEATQELISVNQRVNQTVQNHVASRFTQISNELILRVTENEVVASALGPGSVVAGILYGMYSYAALFTYQEYIIKKEINSNLYLSTTKKEELLNITSTRLLASNLVDMSVQCYNLGLAQGFINSNITTQQYIKDLKCDNLNLNTGNITNINYINAANVNAEGSIKQNNILLDNIYLTSNHLYNLAYNYTAERQYPSKLYNIIQPEDTITLLNKLVYRSNFYVNNQSISYGSGYYEIYSSSTYDTPTTKDRLFNFDTTETTTSAKWGISLYNSETGNYQGDNSIDDSYYGDWVIIKTPQPILLTRYRIYQRSDFQNKAPSLWKVYGSNDGITFTEITEANQTTRLTSYSGGYYEKSLNPSFTKLYNYIGFVFSALLSTSGQTDLSFSELQVFGKEIISNSIVSNIYTTSNAVKSIVENEMPVVKKHKRFNCVVSTAININGTTFYKYDIDLRKYISKGFLEYTYDPYRIFNIQIFYNTSYFSTIVNGLPDVIDSTIFMCDRANPSQHGVAGLNICNIGNNNHPNLRSIPPNNLFLMCNGANSIDYITIVSRRVGDVSVIISDMIG